LAERIVVTPAAEPAARQLSAAAQAQPERAAGLLGQTAEEAEHLIPAVVVRR
jgi:hypothetical protein